MRKVEGSSPFVRLKTKAPLTARLSSFQGRDVSSGFCEYGTLCAVGHAATSRARFS